MSRFEDIKRTAQNVAYTATEKVQEAAAVAGEKAGTVREVAKTNVSLMTEKRNLEKAYQALGEWYAAQMGRSDAPEGAADLIASIRASEDKLGRLKAMKNEQDTSARELLNRGVDFLSGKAEALAALAKKPFDGHSAHELVNEGIESFVEKAEVLAEEAAKGAGAESVHEALNQGVEAAADLVAETKEEIETREETGTKEEKTEE